VILKFVFGPISPNSTLKENHLEYGLLITSKNYSKDINYKDKNTNPLFSDSAVATLIGKELAFV
jgi:3-oxoacyl-[acyl-carrier-protein] synthase III